jgi:RNA polymerase sigma-70 factor (ECF subfamily)
MLDYDRSQPDNPPATPEAEQVLLARLRGGDNAAYRELVVVHAPRLMSVAVRFLGNEADACDAVQDAFLSAFKALPGFGGDSRLGTWLHAIVVRSSLMKLRTRRRKPETPIETLLPQYHADGHRKEPGAGWVESAEQIVQQDETRGLVRSCIDQLPEPHRTVLLLRDIEEYDTDETARMLSISTSAVKTRLHRARQALKTLLDPYFAAPSEAGGRDTRNNPARDEDALPYHVRELE